MTPTIPYESRLARNAPAMNERYAIPIASPVTVALTSPVEIRLPIAKPARAAWREIRPTER
jgi:hypothetical protein